MSVRAEADLLEHSPWFDADWYSARYPDVALAGLEPAVHYLRVGERLGRRPGPGFDPAWYLAEYPDVASAGISPLMHFLRHGETEGLYLSAEPDRRLFAVPEASGLDGVLVTGGGVDKPGTLQLLEERFGDEIKDIFGIHTPALTANEASYLVGFRTADEIRNRCAKAEKETAKRLLSKGHTRSAGR